MTENQSELQSQTEDQVTLAELEAGVRLPDEKPRSNRRRKILLALCALLLLTAVTTIGGYYLLRGERVDVRANKRLPEKIASGKDIKQAAFDSLSGALTGPVPTPSLAQINNQSSSRQPTMSASAPTLTDTTTGGERVPAPTQPGIATVLSAPPQALLDKSSSPEVVQQRDNGLPVKSSSSVSNVSANTSVTKPNVARSVRFAATSKAVDTKGNPESVADATFLSKNDLAGKSSTSNQPATPSLVKRSASPSFGAMLPVRLMGVLYTLRQGSLARLELARDLKGEGWQLRRGTIFVGQTLGGDRDRAYLQIKGFIDPDTQTFTKLEGEVLGNDGGAGMRGKQRRMSPAWVRVLDRTAEAGVQIATGVLNRRSSSVVIAADPYGTYRSASGADGARSDQNRTFVEAPAGTAGFVMVTTLPEVTSDSHLAKEGARSESLTDEELAALIAEADPARIRAALPKMNPELQRVAQLVLKEIEAEKP